MRIKNILLIAGALLLSLPVHSQNKGIQPTQDGNSLSAKERIALVIGNSGYESAPLRNPVNDARSMAAVLRRFGFQVSKLENATQQEMDEAITTFGQSLRRGAVGLFYFSGHGMQVNGENYLIPVDANITTESAVRYKAVNAGLILAQMEDADNPMNVLILDACRNNPFERSFRSSSTGLAQMDAPSGTFISYATAPGSVASDGTGSNGLFTEQLVKHLRTPGLKIEEVFKKVRADVQVKSSDQQTPWESSSLVGEFYFNTEGIQLAQGQQAPIIQQIPVIQAAPVAQIAPDEEIWDSIKYSKDSQDFKNFLKSFPNSKYSGSAKFKINQIENKESKDTSTFDSKETSSKDWFVGVDHKTPSGAEYLEETSWTLIKVGARFNYKYPLELSLGGGVLDAKVDRTYYSSYYKSYFTYEYINGGLLYQGDALINFRLNDSFFAQAGLSVQSIYYSIPGGYLSFTYTSLSVKLAHNFESAPKLNAFIGLDSNSSATAGFSWNL
jgi:hypothetical protein